MAPPEDQQQDLLHRRAGTSSSAPTETKRSDWATAISRDESVAAGGFFLSDFSPEFQADGLTLCSQVSHHPPVSAFYVSNRKDGFCLSGSILAKSKFYGTNPVNTSPSGRFSGRNMSLGRCRSDSVLLYFRKLAVGHIGRGGSAQFSQSRRGLCDEHAVCPL